MAVLLAGKTIVFANVINTITVIHLYAQSKLISTGAT